MLQIKLQPEEDECKPKRCAVIVIRTESWQTTSTLMRGGETGAGRLIFQSVRLVSMMGPNCKRGKGTKTNKLEEATGKRKKKSAKRAAIRAKRAKTS